MRQGKWRWKRTRVLVEAIIIGLVIGVLIILFTESSVDRQRESVGQGIECPTLPC